MNETYTYSFPASQNSEISICAEDPLSTFIITLPENTTDDEIINITFGFDDLTIPNITSITINETVYSKNVVCNYTFPEWALSPDQFQNSTDFLYEMDRILDKRERFSKIKNDYESYIYRIKNNLEYNSTFAKVINETQHENLSQIAQEHQTWLFDDHPEPLNESILRSKYDELHSQVSAAEMRAEEYIKRPPAFQKLNNTLNYIFRQINDTWPETKPWLTEEQVNSVWNQYNQTHDWFEEKYEAQLNTSLFDEPVVRSSEIESKRMVLEWTFNSTNRIPKPTPTPAPKNETSFMTINGKNISFVNGKVTGYWENETFYPGNESTIFEGSNITFVTPEDLKNMNNETETEGQTIDQPETGEEPDAESSEGEQQPTTEEENQEADTQEENNQEADTQDENHQEAEHESPEEPGPTEGDEL